MRLIIASNNAHKLQEIRAILGNHFGEILSLREAGIDHETVEDGNTFLENALKKAREIAEISGCCALADDAAYAWMLWTAHRGSSPPALRGSTETMKRTMSFCWKN